MATSHSQYIILTTFQSTLTELESWIIDEECSNYDANDYSNLEKPKSDRAHTE
jgi:hypothetical protein